MKKLTLLLIVFVGAISLHFIADDLARFGTNQEEFKVNLINLATYKEFPGFKFYYSQSIKKACMSIPVAEQSAAAKSIGKMVKTFVMSTNFKTDYEKNLVQVLESTDRNSAELKEKYDNDYNNNLNSIQENIKVPGFADQMFAIQATLLESNKKALEEISGKDLTEASEEDKRTIKAVQNVYKQGIVQSEGIMKIKHLFKSNPAEFSKQYAKIVAEQALEGAINEAILSNETLLATAQEKKDYKANIKSQLQQFLDESSDVDFGAKTIKSQSGGEEFVNENYKKKPLIWKQCFRIGKPATMAFREIAQEWIREL